MLPTIITRKLLINRITNIYVCKAQEGKNLQGNFNKQLVTYQPCADIIYQERWTMPTYSEPCPMSQDKRDIIAQWAFDVRPLLLRFHLFLQDVETVWERTDYPKQELSEMSFMNGRIERLTALSAAVTALGTKLYGRWGAGKGLPKDELNEVKKDADAISAYAMSESLWYLTRSLPENHALMVCLGEGLMPKGGETPEMGSNPQLGFGRVYARPEIAQWLDQRVVRLLNDHSYCWDDFYGEIKKAGITLWGAAIDTLENTSRFAKGAETGPMTILHIFDQPLVVSKPYEGYMGTLIVPKKVMEKAAEESILINYMTPRELVLKAILDAYPGMKPEHVHIWTLGGPSREPRISTLWDKWRSLGAHVIEDGWKLPNGMAAFTESGTYAPTHHIKTWKDEFGEEHLMLIDGYAASAEAMQAASLAPALNLEALMCVFTSKFSQDWQIERNLMTLEPDKPGFRARLEKALRCPRIDDETEREYRRMLHEGLDAGLNLSRKTLKVQDFFPDRHWNTLCVSGYMCDDPYTGAPGVEKISDSRYKVTVRLTSIKGAKLITFTLDLQETSDQQRLVFSPLLNRFMAGEDYKTRPVRISDSGRIRNELQTLCVEALDFPGEKRIAVNFSRISPAVISPENQKKLLEILQWYKTRHPFWFGWLEIIPPKEQ